MTLERFSCLVFMRAFSVENAQRAEEWMSVSESERDTVERIQIRLFQLMSGFPPRAETFQSALKLALKEDDENSSSQNETRVKAESAGR